MKTGWGHVLRHSSLFNELQSLSYSGEDAVDGPECSLQDYINGNSIPSMERMCFTTEADKERIQLYTFVRAGIQLKRVKSLGKGGLGWLIGRLSG